MDLTSAVRVSIDTAMRPCEVKSVVNGNQDLPKPLMLAPWHSISLAVCHWKLWICISMELEEVVHDNNDKWDHGDG